MAYANQDTLHALKGERERVQLERKVEQLRARVEAIEAALRARSLKEQVKEVDHD